MGLTQKILAFTSLIVVSLVAATVGYTTVQADRLAHSTIDEALKNTRGVWEAFQADRYSKLQLGIRALENDAFFKAALGETDYPTIFDLLEERGAALEADILIATDPEGFVLARTDRPGSQGADLSRDPLIRKPIEEGSASATVWRQDDRLFHAVSVPLQFGPNIVGVLVAGYAIDEPVAGNIRKLTRSEIAFFTEAAGQPATLSVSTLGPRENALKTALAGREPAAGVPFEVDLAEPYVAVRLPLQSATGETVGSVVALRSLAVEKAGFVQFRNSLIVVALVIMVLALALAWVAAKQVTGPVRLLVSLVERARDGSYAGAVAVHTGDEIGVLARAFNSLLADLREKEQLIDFLRDGMTMMKRGGSAEETAPDVHSAETRAMGAVTQSVRLERGALWAGRYEILGVVGKGGMGMVYRARDRQLDEVVALKLLRAEAMQDDPTLLERFKQEIRLARKISHRNVLRTHDFGDADGTPYISMEYLEGVTLKDLVTNRGALPLPVGFRIAKQICLGLEAAHHEGVIHRDMKPQNLLILPETGDVKVMDFGIARVSEMRGGEGGLTSTGTVMGTPDYMPPEQAQGHPADFRSDIYSLGVVLFEIFTGSLPFTGDTVMAVVLKHIQEQPPRPRSLSPRIPEELEAIVLRCLAKQPAARYARVEELLDALSAASAHIESAA